MFKYLTIATLLSLATAVPEAVFSSRSVAAQVGSSSCAASGFSNIRSQRFTEPLKPGEYAFEATVTQVIELRENCQAFESFAQSTVEVADSILVGTQVVADGCDVTTDIESIKGFFTVTDDGIAQITLATLGGPCAKVTVTWDNIVVKRCADRIPKVERQLERSLVDLGAATKGLKDAGSKEERQAMKVKYQEASEEVAELRQELLYALTC